MNTIPKPEISIDDLVLPDSLGLGIEIIRTSMASRESAIRNKLIELGWTPPSETKPIKGTSDEPI